MRSVVRYRLRRKMSLCTNWKNSKFISIGFHYIPSNAEVRSRKFWWLRQANIKKDILAVTSVSICLRALFVCLYTYVDWYVCSLLRPHLVHCFMSFVRGPLLILFDDWFVEVFLLVLLRTALLRTASDCAAYSVRLVLKHIYIKLNILRW